MSDRHPSAHLSPEDLDRLAAACGRRRVDPTHSLFGPGSVTWRVNREGIILLGGARALLLQVAHPLVAAGVAAHSRFRAEPLARLWRTLDLMLTLVFANARRAIDAVRQIERVHARVHGVLEADVGPFPAGTRYDASDPALLLWVYATLVDTAMLAYRRFVAPLTAETWLAYYEESKIGARLLGIPDALIPRTLGEFEAYVDGMIRSDVLSVGPAGRDVAASILHPPLPVGLRHAFRAANLFAVGLLPPALRERYGLSWTTGHEAMLCTVAATTRRALRVVPECVRIMPHARRAARACDPRARAGTESLSG